MKKLFSFLSSVILSPFVISMKVGIHLICFLLLLTLFVIPVLSVIPAQAGIQDSSQSPNPDPLNRTLTKFDEAYIWSWWNYWTSKGKSEEEAIQLIGKDLTLNVTKDKVDAVCTKARTEKWDVQDVEVLMYMDASQSGIEQPNTGIEKINNVIVWIEKYSPQRKDLLGDSYDSRAVAYGKLGDFQNMKKSLNIALELKDIDDFRFRRAGARFKTGDIAGCDADMAVVEKRNPTSLRYLQYKDVIAKWKQQLQIQQPAATPATPTPAK